MDNGKWTVGAIGLGIGVVVGLILAPPPATTPAPPNPALRTLDANLFVQTSPEYRALCLQSYALAGERVRALRKGADGPEAVVMDLDETVFDNSPFQTWMYRRGKTFRAEDWDVWEREKATEVRLVPGAAAFIAEAKTLGLAVFYLSNRLEKTRAGTVAALKHLGIETEDPGPRLLLKTTTSDKTARRAEVAKTHRPVLFVGDTLTDFDQAFASGAVPADAEARRRSIADRWAKVDAEAKRWGASWVVLPNPTYGDFTRFGNDPLGVMTPSTMPD